MTSKKTIDLQEIEEKYNYHKSEAEKWELVLNALKELPSGIAENKIVKKEVRNRTTDNKKQSASARAIEISVNILKSGAKVSSTHTFVEAVNKEGIVTKSGRPFEVNTLSSVLGQSGIVRFNRETKYWELVQ